MWALPLSLLFLNMAVWKRSSLIIGKGRYKTTLPAVTRVPYNSVAVFSRGRNMYSMMPMPRYYHHSYPSGQYINRKCPLSSCDNQPQWYLHQVRTLPCPMWYPCQMVPKTAKQVDAGMKSDVWWKVASVTKDNQCYHEWYPNKEWATPKWKW